MNINDAIKDYLNYITFEKGLSIRTKKSYENDLDIYYNFLKNKNITNINNITNNHIKSFLKERSNESTKTIAHNLTVIKSFHSYLYKQKLTKNDPSEHIERPKVRKTIPKVLSIEEVDKLLDIKLDKPYDYRNKGSS